MSTYLITGASSGLGLQLAHLLAKEQHELILPVRNAAASQKLGLELMVAGAKRVSTPPLDLSSLAGVRAFLDVFNSDQSVKLDGVVLNAGVQSANALEFTVDGFETTFAVNHLAHHVLLAGLRPALVKNPIIGWTASGTHDPKELSARLSGFRGAQYSSASKLAAGDFGAEASVEQACKDAYATSKFCNILSAQWFAENEPASGRYFSFDPGLMPGTGLARKQTGVILWMWERVLPKLVSIMPGTSTPLKSALVLRDLATGKLTGSYNGAYFNYTAKQLKPSEAASDRKAADDLMRTSDSLIASASK